MKKFIISKNQELLEKHPTLWNTKIVWMLGIALVLHILFYLIGFISLINPESLHKSNAIESFLNNGVFLISIMVSILLLVLWLIALFRNNSFKNFYPNTRWKLFKQFASYFIIFIATTSFYYSYTFGLQTYVNITYTNARMEQDVAVSNAASPFFSLKLYDYELDQLRNPAPFDKLYCVTTYGNIDRDKDYYEFKGNFYQFYSIRNEVYEDKYYVHPDSVIGNIYNETKDGKQIFYFKDQVIDVSSHVKTSKPSYYNYKKLFYEWDDSRYRNYYYEPYSEDYNYNPFSKITESEKKFMDRHQSFITAQDPEAYNKLFSDFIEIANEYQIPHNLSVSIWMEMAYTISPYEVKTLIHEGGKPYEPSLSYEEENDFVIYEKAITSQKLFLKAESLRSSFKNIEEIKTTNIFEGTIHFFLWAAFFFACIVFIFRTTSLKSLLFTIVASVLLMILIGLITAFINLILSYNRSIEYFVMYFTLILGTIILLVSLLGLTKIRKLIGSIFMNITLVGFVPYLLLIVLLIDTHQNDWCDYQGNISYSGDTLNHCFTAFDYLGIYWSYSFLLIGFVFIFFFCEQILKWRAKPEG